LFLLCFLIIDKSKGVNKADNHGNDKNKPIGTCAYVLLKHSYGFCASNIRYLWCLPSGRLYSQLFAVIFQHTNNKADVFFQVYAQHGSACVHLIPFHFGGKAFVF